MLIADDEALVRNALRLFVDNAAGMSVVAEATTGAEAVSRARAVQPDVILMDIQMPTVDGIDATAQLVATLPGARVLAVTTFASEKYIVAALRAGASGYLIKDTAPDALVQAIRDIHEGRAVLSPDISRELVHTVRQPNDRIDRLTEHLSRDATTLTPREYSVVRLLAEGLSNSEIAERLVISEATVKSNLGRVIQKWGVRDRVQVLIFAAREGIVSL
ncbi:response regulator [Mycetocola reblochoni]|uniref:DNA-binding response regulator, LuxR family n=1 Tax=Mycetocola reblochoni REB411 TaxID=1255698 RepID=A0A1R4K755_9MICO|nr:response regulator transcription factor [Mycetocola reblochoni]SJN39962.1 DNA-binding response regulator, LuxR family [Mycetocola reblochoni REB411]